jgi:D-methionine transport system substrate-binding protein
MKKLFALVLTLAVLSVAVVGCGKTAPTSTPAAGEKKEVTLKVGATPVPHAEILEAVKPILAKEGIKLEIKEFSDYVQPNMALDSNQLDANFFQHIPYLETFNKDKGLHLTYIAKVHIEPMGVYSKQVKDLKDLKDGATVAIPNDPSQVGRSLALLQKAGILKLKEGVGVKGTVQDIAENPKNLKVVELDAPQLPRVLDDAKIAAAVINTNFALQANLNPVKDSIYLEDKESPYVNVLAVREADKTNEALQKLAKALNSPEIKKFIEDKYKGAVVPAF